MDLKKILNNAVMELTENNTDNPGWVSDPDAVHAALLKGANPTMGSPASASPEQYAQAQAMIDKAAAVRSGTDVETAQAMADAHRAKYSNTSYADSDNMGKAKVDWLLGNYGTAAKHGVGAALDSAKNAAQELAPKLNDQASRGELDRTLAWKTLKGDDTGISRGDALLQAAKSTGSDIHDFVARNPGHAVAAGILAGAGGLAAVKRMRDARKK